MIESFPATLNNLRDLAPDKAGLKGTLELFGIHHYAHLFEVEEIPDEGGDGTMQQPVNDPVGH